jgi:TPR repeat protein
MDVDHVPAGVDFVEYLNNQVAACDVFLAVIGPNWVDAKDESGHRRFDNPNDYVTVEIAAALARNIRVIPVLVDGARTPNAEKLPDPIKPLVRRNAVEVRNTNFGRDAEALTDKVREALKSARSVMGRWRSFLKPAAWLMVPGRWRRAALGATVLLFAWIGLHQIGVPVWVPWPPRAEQPESPGADKSKAGCPDGGSGKIWGGPQRVQSLDCEQQRQSVVAMADKAKAAAGAEAEAQRKAEEAEQQRLAAAKGDASAMTNLAMLYANGQGVAQDYAKAREWYEKAADKGDASAMIRVGRLYLNGQGVEKDYAKARAWYEKAADKGDASAMTNLAMLYANGQGVAQDYAKAREWYEKAAGKGDASAKTNLNLLEDAEARAKAEQAEKERLAAAAAEERRKQAEAEARTRYAALMGQARTELDNGDNDRVIATANEAIRLDPNSAEAFAIRGHAYNRKDDYDRAISDSDEAIRLNPKIAEAFATRGSVYLDKGDYDRAIADANEAIRLDPKITRAFFNRANAYVNKDDNDRAIADYNEAIRLDPKNARAFCNRGIAKLKINDPSGNEDKAKARQLDASICR